MHSVQKGKTGRQVREVLKIDLAGPCLTYLKVDNFILKEIEDE